jgi:hypothetical protein
VADPDQLASATAAGVFALVKDQQSAYGAQTGGSGALSLLWTFVLTTGRPVSNRCLGRRSDNLGGLAVFAYFMTLLRCGRCVRHVFCRALGC